MELDTGSAVSIINLNDFKKSFNFNLKLTDMKLTSYCNNLINVIGVASVKVELFDNAYDDLKLFVVESNRHPLFGREWIKNDLDWNKIMNNNATDVVQVNSQNETDSHTRLAGLLDKYAELFGEVAELKGEPISLNLKPNAKPVFVRARPVPFALKEKIEKELSDMTSKGFLKKVDFSNWATPIVPVVKPGGKVRLCGDFKVTLNPQLEIEEHPLPTIDELFSKLNGGNKFSKIDLCQAYMQWEVREEDKEKLTLSTHKGLYQCQRLMFGLSCAPAKWQRKIESVLQGIDGLVVFIDDICLTADNDIEHLKRLEIVFNRLKETGLRINLKKSEFLSDKITYCGYKIDKMGIHKSIEKVEAISKAPAPNNITELKSFLGCVNYYARFFNQLSTTLEPLHSLLRKGTKWHWSKSCERAFKNIKEQMMTDKFLIHYSDRLPLILAVDASSIGVSAVLSHVCEDGIERPIQFASQSLNETQRNWSQIDKEAYAIVYGVTKFYKFLFMRKFILYTDHKPLIHIFSPTKTLPHMSATRLLHYAIFLQGFNYEIRYKRSQDNANADCFSRLPLEKIDPRYEESDLYEINQIETLPILPENLRQATKEDENLKELLIALRGDQEIPHHIRFGIDPLEFSIQNGIIMRGMRVIVPKKYQKQILEELHEAHFGIERMKALARSFCWWSHIEDDIAEFVRNCIYCCKNKKNPPKVATHHWLPPTQCFERVHVDFAGPFMGVYFLILIDAYSKWPEVYIIKKITSEKTIEILRQIFSTFGLPSILCTDNGTQFTSELFKKFITNNGIKHKFTAPYNPSTNGLAERFVQTLKHKLTTIPTNKNDMKFNVTNILTHYRITPHPSTNKAPADLIFNYIPKNKFTILLPKRKSLNFEEKTELKKSFGEGERVAVRNYNSDQKWNFGSVEEKLGKVHYRVKLDDGRCWKRHTDQMYKIGKDVFEEVENDFLPTDHIIPDPPPERRDSDVIVTVPPEPTLRRSLRNRKPVNNF